MYAYCIILSSYIFVTHHKPYIVGIVNAIKVAIPPTIKMETRITHSVSVSEAFKTTSNVRITEVDNIKIP